MFFSGEDSYNITTPSLVRAVNLIPTGSESRADWRAMCSLPFPDAIESATSRPSNFPCNFFSSSFLSGIRDLFGSNSMKSNASPWTVNSFAKAGPSTTTFSHSPFWISPEIWPHVPFPVDNNATSSILKIILGII